MEELHSTKKQWLVILCASVILMVFLGIRQSNGLLVQPLADASAMDIAAISLVIAVGQLVWGVAQALFGMLADQKGYPLVLFLGALLLGGGYATLALLPTPVGIALGLGLLIPCGGGAASFSVLIGSTAAQLSTKLRPLGSGIINAGGSIGQFLFAPVMQGLLVAGGLSLAGIGLAVVILCTIPLTILMRVNAPPVRAAREKTATWPAVKKAFSDKSYLFIHLSLLTSGYHISLITTHLPGTITSYGFTPAVAAMAVSIVGLFNIAGSLVTGALGMRFRMKMILFGLYVTRAAIMLLFLFLPKSTILVWVLAAVIGLTWMAAVPPTTGLMGKLYGPQHLATLIGLTMFTHQIGGFFGSYLGGFFVSGSGSYFGALALDVVMAGIAAVCNLPIKEEKSQVRPKAEPEI